MKPKATCAKSRTSSQVSEIGDSSSRKIRPAGSVAWICVALAIFTFAVYLQAGNHHFLSFDDNVYVTANPHMTGGLTGKNMLWAFTSTDESNWHPITWLSHLADVQCYGMNPRGHHLTGVAIHAVSSLLLLLFLFRTTGALWKSSFVAALFALHPLHVESVAWVAERKDVLSAFFGFLTLLVYAEFSEKRKPWQYILCIFCFVLGLMSKPMLVTLPVVMLLMDYWPLDRFRRGDRQPSVGRLSERALLLAKEKIPFFCCSILSAVITIYAQHHGGATRSLEETPFILRIENALVSYVKYLLKTLWPSDLAVLYPITFSIPLWQTVGSLLLLATVTTLVIKAGCRQPYLVVGWFWFLITLVPVIGLIQVGNQAMADRYSYIPAIGLFIMAAWGIPVLTSGLKQQKTMLAVLSVAIIAASAALTWRQLGYWQDNLSLYRHALQVTTDNYVMMNNLGIELSEKGDLDGAIRAHNEAIRINPNFAASHNNLGCDLDKKGDLDGAIREYQLSLILNPNNAQALNNLGADFSEKGNPDAAIQKYREALQISHDDPKAHYNLGRAFTKKGMLDDAVREFATALQLSPDDAKSHVSLGLALAAKGDPEGAIREYGTAIKISPDDPEARNNLGVALVNKGDLVAAIQEFQQILRTSPDDVDAHSNLGVALAKKGEFEAAIREFQDLLRINPNDSYARNNLDRVLSQRKTSR